VACFAHYCRLVVPGPRFFSQSPFAPLSFHPRVFRYLPCRIFFDCLPRPNHPPLQNLFVASTLSRAFQSVPLNFSRLDPLLIGGFFPLLPSTAGFVPQPACIGSDSASPRLVFSLPPHSPRKGSGSLLVDSAVPGKSFPAFSRSSPVDPAVALRSYPMLDLELSHVN